MLRTFTQKNFNKGTIDTIEDFSIPEESASKSLNWLTKGDKIELSGGYAMIDPDNAKSGTGRVTGLHVSQDANGDNKIFYSHGKKVEYLDSSDEWQEIGTDLLGFMESQASIAGIYTIRLLFGLSVFSGLIVYLSSFFVKEEA